MRWEDGVEVIKMRVVKNAVEFRAADKPAELYTNARDELVVLRI